MSPKILNIFIIKIKLLYIYNKIKTIIRINKNKIKIINYIYIIDYILYYIINYVYKFYNISIKYIYIYITYSRCY